MLVSVYAFTNMFIMAITYHFTLNSFLLFYQLHPKYDYLFKALFASQMKFAR